jgi:hypothetical protein
MIINGKLRDFACNVIAKGQMTLGDVRRLQRGYLPGGITNREEFEILIFSECQTSSSRQSLGAVAHLSRCGFCHDT